MQKTARPALPGDYSGTIIVVGARCLGDAVMTLPALAAVRLAWPAARIVLVAPGGLAARVYALAGYGDSLAGETNRGILRQLLLFRRLRRGRPGAVILFSGGFVWALGALLSGARLRAGLSGDNRDFLLTHVVPRQGEGTHQSDVALACARLLASGAGQESAGFAFSRRGRRERLVVLVPGASHEAKRWPTEFFIALARRLCDAFPSFRVVIAGSRAELGLCRAIAAGCGAPEADVFAAEIEELVPLFGRAALCVAGTTGLAHLAAACNCRVLSLSGAAGPDRGTPRGAGNVSLGMDVVGLSGKRRGILRRLMPRRAARAMSRRILRALTPDLVFAYLRSMVVEASKNRDGASMRTMPVRLSRVSEYIR